MRKSLPVSSYQHRSLPASCSRLVNCFAEQLPPDAETPLVLMRAPGVDDWTTVGTGPIYDMIEADDLLYVVSGSELYSVDENKNATLIGNIGAVTSIDMERNADAVVVVNTPNMYSWDGVTFAQVTDVDFTAVGAQDIEFVDNYLTFTIPNSDTWGAFDLGSSTSYDALFFASAESSPDQIVGHIADHGQIVIAGKKSMEIWQNTGIAGFPFERAINGRMELGCLNGKSLAKQDNTVFWLASDYTVRRLNGITPVRVSHHGIEQAMHNMTISTAKAFSYSQDGHLFYVLSFFERTFIYDCTTQEWHERASYGYDYWRPQSHAQVFGLELVGDITSNKIGSLDPEVYDEFGTVQRMEWTYQPISNEQQVAFHKRLEIVPEVGVGLTTGQGSDPQMMLEYSDDGGRTFLSMPTRSMGAIGRYTDRVAWHALGSSRVGRVYRGAVSDPVKVIVRDTLAEIVGGRW